MKTDRFKTPRFVQTISLWPPRQRPLTLQKPGVTLFAKMEHRRLRQCSSCCAVGKVCTLPTIMDSLDSNATTCASSLFFAVCYRSQSEPPFGNFHFEEMSCQMPAASKGSLNLFRNNLMPVGLASIATSPLLIQCSARQHSNGNSKCWQLKT